MRILIAEDERITRSSLVRQLETLGHEVVAAADGEEAWESFNQSGFDLIITDWEMPRLSGLDLIRRIRGTSAAKFVYILMLTGRTDKADVVNGIEAGADDFLSKPFDKEELRVRLLAGERIVTLERTLSRQNGELRDAGERMRKDLAAAARVQQAMLPRENVVTPTVRTAWKYVPTDALAGDAIGLHLIEDRYLVAYVIDVSGHGVPAALLSVTAMHALAPVPEATSLLRDLAATGAMGTVRAPGRITVELNRRFRSEESDGRFLTTILCVLDTQTGRMDFARAGHPHPIVVRRGSTVPVGDDGGPPIAIIGEAEYPEESVQLEPGDRVYLYSDGLFEQHGAGGGPQFGTERLTRLFSECDGLDPEVAAEKAVRALADWAGGEHFEDDVSIVAIDWTK